MKPKKRVLMVCLGNICRSPLAEALLRSKVSDDYILVDSAGLDSYHVGEAPCQTSKDIALKNGLDISNLRARHFTVSDFDKFDHIYIMDKYNWELIKRKARNDADLKKVDFILNEIFPGENMEVPDSYQKGKNAAELVFKMLNEATDAIAKKLS
jgi:protein-tyrosine phosphatase